MGQASTKHYLFVASMVFLILFAGNIAVSLFLDPYGVFGLSGFNKRNFEPNTRYLKIEKLRLSNNKEAFILGSSRVNHFGVDVSETLLKIPFYNMTASGETGYGIYLKTKWLLENQQVKHIVFGLDFDQFDQLACCPSAVLGNEINLVESEHPDISGEWPPLFYWQYLWTHPKHHAVNLYGNLFNKVTWYEFDPETGHYYNEYRDLQMHNNPEAYIKRRFPERDYPDYHPDPEQIRYWQQAIELLRERRVPYTVIINPAFYKRYESYDMDRYASWVREIVLFAGSAWDFSGFNSVTTNPRNWYEHSHFRFEIGTAVLRRIFTGKVSSKFPDFGSEVTRETLTEHLRRIKKNYNAWMASG